SDLLKEFKGNVELKNKVETVNNNLEMLRAYTDFFDSTMRKNSQRHKNILEIRQIINSFFKSMQPSIERKQFIVEIDYDSYGIWTKPIHESEMSSVLINLFTNSSKAIYRAGAHPGKLGVFVSTNDDEILIRFEDNGDGISLDKREKVFNALYTTALPNAAYSQEEESLRGMGLGLSIVKDIIDGLDGSIYVTEPSEGYNTCFEIKLPRASAEEIPDDIY
ncbi:sensor histidine kinase, partial [Rahnella bruchi]